MAGEELLEINFSGEGGLRHLRELPIGVEQEDSSRHGLDFSRSLYTSQWRKHAGTPKKAPAARKNRGPIVSRPRCYGKSRGPIRIASFSCRKIREPTGIALFSCRKIHEPIGKTAETLFEDRNPMEKARTLLGPRLFLPGRWFFRRSAVFP
jgi:hypothetical protein